MQQDTIEQRIYDLNNGRQVTLAVEGRATNLRIYTGKNANGKYHPSEHDTVYMRLDKYKDFSAPLSETSAGYLRNKSDVINKLLKFGFMSDISNLPDILEITKDLKYRPLLEW